MKISIITATYNSAATLVDAMDSVIEQSYRDLEYIIVDGASSDGTMDILESYSSSNFRVISEPDLGIYDAINKGIRLASGDVVGILNSDDFFADKDVLKRVASYFENDSSLDSVYSDVLFVNRNDRFKPLRYYSSKFFKPFMFRFGFQPAHPTFYVKTKIFREYGFYRTDLKIAGDFELLLRFLMVKKISSKYVNDLWVKMRVGGISSSGIRSIVTLNKEIIFACKANEVYTNLFFIYAKYLVKWWGFVMRRSRPK